MTAIDELLGRAEAGTCSPGDVRELAEQVRFQRDLLEMAKEAGRTNGSINWYLGFLAGAGAVIAGMIVYDFVMSLWR